jgi:hypothetical protein
MDAVRAAYDSLSDRAPWVSFEDFERFAEKCEVHPIVVGGQCAGALVVQGPEIHACILPWAHKRWLNRTALSIMNEVISKHGKAITRATTEAGRQFVERLGFKPEGDIYVRSAQYGC